MDFIEPCFGIGHNLSLICQMTSEDIKHQLIIIDGYINAMHSSLDHREKIEEGGQRINEVEWTEQRLERQNLWQQTKHVKLYSGLLSELKRGNLW